MLEPFVLLEHYHDHLKALGEKMFLLLCCINFFSLSFSTRQSCERSDRYINIRMRNQPTKINHYIKHTQEKMPAM